MKRNSSLPCRHPFLLAFLGAVLVLNGCSSMYQPLPKPSGSYPAPSGTTTPSRQPETERPAQSQAPLPVPQEQARPAPPTGYTARTGSAGSLYRQSQQFMARGDYRQAELTLERALRIEPRNGYYWYAMADLKYRQNQNGKAVQFCLKSKSLAGQDRQLMRLNDNLIEMAR